MSVWDMGGMRWDVAGGMCRGAMDSRHRTMLQEAPGQPESPQFPWNVGVDMGPVSIGRLLKQSVAPQNVLCCAGPTDPVNLVAVPWCEEGFTCARQQEACGVVLVCCPPHPC